MKIGLLCRGFLASILLASTINAAAIIANPEPVKFNQPDGSIVTLSLHGDERCSFTTTSQGYTVAFNPSNHAWEYARLSATGQLEPGGETAADNRAPIAATRWLRPLATAIPGDLGGPRRAPKAGLASSGYDYSKFRGLVILVEYNDCPFSRSDIATIFNDMVNMKNYDGYLSNHALPTKIPCTGSVRDYYFDNSNGQFDPQFDVVGPVKIDYSRYFARKSSGAQVLARAALEAANPLVDFSRYDSNGDRQVDMVYFIFSGAGSNYSGNNADLIWPHASTVIGMTLDGYNLGRYACSTELYGPEVSSTLDGIGTMCHEFSHVLGLPDLYDTDYDTNGRSIDPGRWSIMASGSYLNKSKTPCGYSLFERHSLGFATPRVINEAGNYTIAPVNQGDSPDGCIINSSIPDEYFTLECRAKTRWDEYLPGQGLLVHRVEKTNPKAWETNTVNAASAHNYYELLRATPKKSGTTVTDSDGDPFPGSGSVTSLTNSTSPSLRSWAKTPTPLVLNDITLTPEGNVTFSVAKEEIPMLVENFTSMTPTADDGTRQRGRFTEWTLAKGAALATDTTKNDTYLATVKGAEVVSAPFRGEVENMRLYITNTSGGSATFRLSYADSEAGPWTSMRTATGANIPSVAIDDTAELHYKVDNLSGKCFKLTQYSGSTTRPCRVDYIEFTIKAGTGDDPAAAPITIVTDSDATPEWYTLQGLRVENPTTPGLYIERRGSRVKKIIIR